MTTKTKTFYDLVSQDQRYKIAVGSSSPKTITNYTWIQHLLKFGLRPYQIEALSAFQLFWNDGFDSRSLKQKTIQGAKDDEDRAVQWHKVGFEMATGSGKTLLMGATILDLHQKGFKDFLILTPNTILFDKTIENFSPRAVKSIFGDGWNLTYNLVTGNTYRDKTCNYEQGRDISFYVFNIQKFYDKAPSSETKDDGDTMKGTPYVRRPLEDSLWRDRIGNHTISFVEFLRERRPVIISDEAHHYYQKKTTEAIFELLPSIVLEFTATSVEKGSTESIGQNNLYKYPMQRYISEGYGKRIFAVGCGTSDEISSDAVTDGEKQKLVWGMLIHLLKWESLSALSAPVKKAMLLTRARSIKHADAVDAYLKNWPDSVRSEVDDVLEQVNREGTDIAKIVRQYNPKSKSELMKKLSRVAKSVFTIHSENKSDEEILTEYQSLDDNKAEIVNQVKMFTEGVDYDNFYTIVVLADTVEKVGLAAAQLIGRGLRLYKENREFDGSGHALKEQSEILHVICERGHRFDQIVEEIRQNLELSPGSVEVPTEEEDRENKINRKVIDDYEIPILQIKSVATGKSFEDTLKDKALSVGAFLDEVCGLSKGDKVLKPEVLAMVDYAEITTDEVASQTDKPTTTRRTITLPKNDDSARWALDFIEQTGSFIGNNSFATAKKLIETIINSGIQVDTAYAIDYKRALRALKRSIIDFYSRKSFELMFKSQFAIRKENVKQIFADGIITVRKRDGLTINLMRSDQAMSSHLQQKGVIVEGYKHSVRPYVKFDSPPEKWVADALERLCSLDKKEKSFWVRNEPRTEYPVEAKPGAFYPDFLAFIGGEWIIVDVKGKHLAEAKQIDDRKQALKLLEKEGGIKTFFLVDKVMEKRGFKAVEIASVDDFVGFDELRHEELGLEEFTNGQTQG